MPVPLALWDVWTPIAGPPVAFEPPSAGFALDWRALAGDPKVAAEVAKAAAKGKSGANGAPQIELVITTDGNGHRHVTDPTRGTAAWARADVVSWGLFGVVVGAVAGAVGGGGNDH